MSRRVLRLFVLFFSPFLVLATAGLLLVVSQGALNLENHREAGAQRTVRIIKNLTELEIRSVVSDVLVLALYPEVGRLLNAADTAGHRALAQSVLAHCRGRGAFAYISLVDRQGREVVRVRCRPGADRIVDSSQLARPCRDPDLAAVDRLAPNEVLVYSQHATDPSSQTEAEDTWLLKVAAPLYGGDGRRTGTLLAAHSGSALVREVREEIPSGSDGYLVLDAQGRSLFQKGGSLPVGGQQPEEAAGLAVRRPAVWERLSAADAGVVRMDGEAYHFQTVHPGLEGLKQSTGAGQAALVSAAAGGFASRHWWKVVVPRPDAGWAARLAEPLWPWVPAYGAAVVAMGLGCWALAAVVARRQEASRARRLAAERLRIRSAFEHAPLGMAVLSLDGRFLMVNEHLRAMLDRRWEEIQDLPARYLVHPADRSLLSSALDAVLEKKEPSSSRDLRLQAVDGRPIFCRFSVALYRESRGRPLHFIAHVQDLSDSRRMQEEKEAMEAELRQAQKLEAIGILASGIAHDMNNILGIMNANTELALRDLNHGPASPQALRLERVLRAGVRGRELVEKILNFCQLSDAERQPLDLAHEVDEAVKLLEASLPKNVSFRKNYGRPSPRILASFADLQQIMANLCLNASQAMAPQGGTIAIKVGEVWPDQAARWGCGPLPAGRWCGIRVTDTGHGMDPETRGRIFDPFFTTKGGGGGTGLGLATVQRIVNNLGGFMTVESQAGRGSSFNVILPLTEQEPCRSEEPPEVPSGRAVGRILLVDDEADFAGVLKEGLEELGHTVTAFQSPLPAWGLFQEDPREFDLLITDQHMGGMSGTDLAERVHGLRPDMPIVVCSGSYHTLDLDRERAIGVVRILRKPFSILDLNGVLNQVLTESEGDRLREVGT